jgi:hypothetical protein
MRNPTFLWGYWLPRSGGKAEMALLVLRAMGGGLCLHLEPTTLTHAKIRPTRGHLGVQ